jgi:hypothetical protein
VKRKAKPDSSRRSSTWCNRKQRVWCVGKGGRERRRWPNLDGKAVREGEPATLDL